MWSFCGPFTPATLRLDGACAAGKSSLCWSGSEFFGWSQPGGRSVLPPLGQPPVVVRSTDRGVFVLCDNHHGPEHEVSFWRPGESDWAWRARVPRIEPNPRTQSVAPLVAVGSQLLGIYNVSAFANPVRVWRLGGTSLDSVGLAYGCPNEGGLFVGGPPEEDGSLLALGLSRAFRLRVEAGRASLEPLWEVPQPFLRPACSPVVIGDLVVFPRKDDAPPRVFDLRSGEISNPLHRMVDGGLALWSAWATGDRARTARLLDDLSGVPWSFPDMTPLAFLEDAEGVVAVATTRGLVVRVAAPSGTGVNLPATGGLYASSQLSSWRQALEIAGPPVKRRTPARGDLAPDPDIAADLARAGTARARRGLDRIRTLGGDPSSDLPPLDRDLLPSLDSGPGADSAAGEFLRDLRSSDAETLVAVLRAVAELPGFRSRFLSPGSDPGPAALAGCFSSPSSSVVLAALRACVDPATVEALAGELHEPLGSADPRLRRRTLERLTPRLAGVPPLREACERLQLCDPDPDVRVEALYILRQAAPGQLRSDVFLETVSDPCRRVREVASVRMEGLSGARWAEALGGAVDRLFLDSQDGTLRRPGSRVAEFLERLVKPGLPKQDPDDQGVAWPTEGSLAAILYRLFGFAWCDTEPEEDELESLVESALDCAGSLEEPLRSCGLGVFRNGSDLRGSLQAALAVAGLEPRAGRRCVLFALAARPEITHASAFGSRARPDSHGRPLHVRLRVGGETPEAKGLSLLAREARSGDSFSHVALWFLASRGMPGAFEELRRQLPAACAKWRTLVVAWARLAPDPETRRAGIREVLLSSAIPAAYRLQIQAELLPDPFVDGHGPGLLPYFEAVARDATIPFNERREAALRARRAGNPRVLVDLWNGLSARPPGDFPDDAREGDLAGTETLP